MPGAAQPANDRRPPDAELLDRRRPQDAELVDRVALLSVEQKARLLTGADFWSLFAEPAVGLRSLVVSDGPAGARGTVWDERSTSANLPSPTALAASWDVDLVARLGALLAAECRRKGVDVLLAPTVNLHRSPYGGRHFECYSEDPLLTAEIGAAMVRGLQSHGVGATVKHFVANDSETERYTADMLVDEQALRELYLQPFEVIVREAGAWAVMAAYNAVNGCTMTQSPLLASILREEWGFDGVTMTDWFAGRSVEPAGNAALDLMMPGPASPWRDGLADAVRAGRVPQPELDEKVLRLLRLAARVGALDGVAPDRSAPHDPPPDAPALLREAASSGFVLLRNEPAGEPGGRAGGEPLLPLTAGGLSRVALVGPNAAHGRTLGGGSALVFPPYTVSPLEGLRAALPASVEVVTAVGVRAHTRLPVADVAMLSCPDGAGVRVSFLDGAGDVVHAEHRAAGMFTWMGNPLAPAAYPRAVRVDTVLTARVAGDYTVGASGVGRFRLLVDGAEAFDAQLALAEGADFVEGLMAPPQEGHAVHLAAGQSVALELVHEPAPAHRHVTDSPLAFQLNVDLPYEGDEAEIARAVGLAAASDVAVVVVGTTEEVESEGFDRSSLALPGRQDELVARVAAVNPRTVVVVNAGAPVLMPWREQVPALLLTWFPGQEFGNGLADVLLGAAEPGGRLPTTWPAVEDATIPSTRPVDGVVRYDEGLDIGYRRFLRDGVQPAYWFGHGLGYTRWRYASVQAVPETSTGEGDGRPGRVVVTARVANTGPRHGREVVQAYLSRPDSAVRRPALWLGGYAVVQAEPGEQVDAVIGLDVRRFQHWDPASGSWQLEPGRYRVHLASSAGAVHASTDVELGRA